MQRVYLIFDYFKEAFHINRNNKRIYLPQILFIVIKALIILVGSIYVSNWLKTNSFYMLNEKEVFDFLISNLVNFLLIGITYLLVFIALESGLYYMYKACVFGKGLVKGDFLKGVKKYFFKFLLINLLIAISTVIIFPIAFLFGILTLFVGFIIVGIIFMIADIFVNFWKISLVVNDSGIFTAFKDSISFLKRCFLPVVFIQIIYLAFSGISRLSSSFSFRSNIDDFINISRNFNHNLMSYFNIDFINRMIRIVMSVIIPVITISTIVSSLIVMVFKVFFSLSLFVAYKHNFNTGNTTNREGYNDVVV